MLNFELNHRWPLIREMENGEWSPRIPRIEPRMNTNKRNGKWKMEDGELWFLHGSKTRSRGSLFSQLTIDNWQWTILELQAGEAISRGSLMLAVINVQSSKFNCGNAGERSKEQWLALLAIVLIRRGGTMEDGELTKVWFL